MKQSCLPSLEMTIVSFICMQPFRKQQLPAQLTSRWERLSCSGSGHGRRSWRRRRLRRRQSTGGASSWCRVLYWSALGGRPSVFKCPSVGFTSSVSDADRGFVRLGSWVISILLGYSASRPVLSLSDAICLLMRSMSTGMHGTPNISHFLAHFLWDIIMQCLLSEKNLLPLYKT